MTINSRRDIRHQVNAASRNTGTREFTRRRAFAATVVAGVALVATATGAWAAEKMLYPPSNGSTTATIYDGTCTAYLYSSGLNDYARSTSAHADVICPMVYVRHTWVNGAQSGNVSQTTYYPNRIATTTVKLQLTNSYHTIWEIQG
jgi:hypothetical protein